MNVRIERLRAEIRADRGAVAGWLDDLAGLPLGGGADRGVLSRAAWALHHAYSGVEAIIERTMRTIEGSVPTGPDFHKALLDSAALPIDGVRPAMLMRETVRGLHDLRAFRHFVRHAYHVDLEADRLADLQARAAALRPSLEADFDALDSWLAQVSAASESP